MKIAMKTDPNLTLLVDELKNKFGCHTLILYGSRARGDAKETSDYDIMGIKAEGDVIVRDAREWHGFYLDAFIYPESKVHPVQESMLHMRDGMILCEKDQIGTKLLKSLRELDRQGPKKLADDEIRARKVWYQKMLARARAGDMEGNFRRMWLLTALIEDYFVVQGKWYRGPKESFAWLQVNQPNLYECYENAIRPDAPLTDIETLVNQMTLGW
jgi:predicted nucleotidyltransferase